MTNINDEMFYLLVELGNIFDKLSNESYYHLQMLDGLLEHAELYNLIDDSKYNDDETAVRVCEGAWRELLKLQAAYDAYRRYSEKELRAGGEISESELMCIRPSEE